MSKALKNWKAYNDQSVLYQAVKNTIKEVDEAMEGWSKEEKDEGRFELTHVYAYDQCPEDTDTEEKERAFHYKIMKAIYPEAIK